MLNGPTQIALTFIDHFDPSMRGARAADTLTAPVRDLIRGSRRRPERRSPCSTPVHDWVT